MALITLLSQATYTNQTISSGPQTMPGNLNRVGLYCDPVGMTAPAQELVIQVERFDVAAQAWTFVASAHAIGGLYVPKAGGPAIAPARVGVIVSAVDLRGQQVRGSVVVTGTVTMTILLDTAP